MDQVYFYSSVSKRIFQKDSFLVAFETIKLILYVKAEDLNADGNQFIKKIFNKFLFFENNQNFIWKQNNKQQSPKPQSELPFA